jgi:hypothetical protein
MCVLLAPYLGRIPPSSLPITGPGSVRKPGDCESVHRNQAPHEASGSGKVQFAAKRRREDSTNAYLAKRHRPPELASIAVSVMWPSWQKCPLHSGVGPGRPHKPATLHGHSPGQRFLPFGRAAMSPARPAYGKRSGASRTPFRDRPNPCSASARHDVRLQPGILLRNQRGILFGFTPESRSLCPGFPHRRPPIIFTSVNIVPTSCRGFAGDHRG